MEAVYTGTLSKLSENPSDFREEMTGLFDFMPQVGRTFKMVNDKPLTPGAQLRVVVTSCVARIIGQTSNTTVFQTETGSIYRLERQ